MAVTTAGSSITSEAASPRPRGTPWVFQVTALSLMLGCFLGIALQAQRALRAEGLPGNRYSEIVPFYLSLRESNRKLEQEVQELRAKTVDLQTRMASGTGTTQALRKELQNLQMLSGLAPVHGPGLIINLRDYPHKLPEKDQQLGLIHDQDLAAILNELKAAGAEALAIAGVDGRPQRIVLTSAPRCAGPVIRVNDAPLSGPFTIWAIGDPAGLESALKIQGGVVENLQLEVLGMISFKQSKEIKLPRYSGSIEYKYARPVGSSQPLDPQ